ncbi:MAG: hypothetical protein ACK58T_32880 [Phycisphaerae bacterium]|jgi:hypothetical protein
MDRLKSAESGALDAANAVIGHSAAYPGLGAGALPTGLRRESWGLDKLGNWSVGLDPPPTTVTQLPSPGCGWPAIPWGQTDDTITVPWPGGGTTGGTSSAIGHRVERVDSAANVTSESAGGHLPSDFNVQAPWSEQWALNAVRWRMQRDAAGQETWTRHLADANGNLVYDGAYFYQYDAWNRLIQVNDATGTHWVWFEGYNANGGQKLGTPRWKPPEGQFPGTCPPATIGPVIKHYNYDGVGRVVRTTTPLTAEWFGAGYTFNGSATATRSERFFYDGARRVQDIVTDPVLMNEEGDIVSLTGEVQGGQPGNGGSTIALGTPYLRMQHIWGPGDGHAGAYELLAELDPTGKLWPAVQDAQGDVVALLEKTGSSAAQVAAQWTYSPYGEVLSRESFTAGGGTGPSVPTMVFGHKGLATDRLDKPLDFWDSSGQNLFDTQRLEPGANTLVYANNRTLKPSLGRWMQQDPNASGQGLIASIGIHGGSEVAVAMAIVLETRIGDGLSLFGYARANPVQNGDPLGLFVGTAFTPYATIAVTAGQIAYGLASGYADNESFNADWASDWSLPDDWHTRGDNSWIQDVYDGANVNGAVDSYALIDPVPEYMMGRSGSVIRASVSIGGKLLTGIAHHAFPQYMAKLLKRSSNIVFELPHKFHTGKGGQAIHAFIDRALAAYGAPHMRASRDQLAKWVKKVGPEKAVEIMEGAVKYGSQMWGMAVGAAPHELKQINELIKRAIELSK